MSCMRKDMVQAGRDACADNVMYIYGAKPEGKKWRVYSLDEIRQLRSEYGANVWASDDAKAGELCCDCSGLISKATGVIKGSWYLFDEAPERVPIDVLRALADKPERWARYAGWGLYMPGHVGIVSDVPGYYFAMDGSARNAVHYPLEMQGWTYAFRVAGVDYDSGSVVEDVERMVAMNDWFTLAPGDGATWLYEPSKGFHKLANAAELASVQKLYKAVAGKEIAGVNISPEDFERVKAAIKR